MSTGKGKQILHLIKCSHKMSKTEYLDIINSFVNFLQAHMNLNLIFQSSFLFVVDIARQPLFESFFLPAVFQLNSHKLVYRIGYHFHILLNNLNILVKVFYNFTQNLMQARCFIAILLVDCYAN